MVKNWAVWRISTFPFQMNRHVEIILNTPTLPIYVASSLNILYFNRMANPISYNVYPGDFITIPYNNQK